MSGYSELLRDPRWQKKRLQILERENWTCETCGATDQELHVHHGYYERDKMPWDYHDDTLHCLCWECHSLAEMQRKISAHLMSLLGAKEFFIVKGFVIGMLGSKAYRD